MRHPVDRAGLIRLYDRLAIRAKAPGALWLTRGYAAAGVPSPIETAGMNRYSPLSWIDPGAALAPPSTH